MELPEDPSALLDDLSVRIYGDPLQHRWADRRRLPEVIRTVVLLLDLDTELHMNGLGGLVESSTGQYLPEIVSALQAVGAERTASAIRTVGRILARHGITTSALRATSTTSKAFAVTTFEAVHGHGAAAMLSELESSVAPELYVYNRHGEHPMRLLEDYVARHLSEIRALTAEALEAAPG